jgi:hypothetical protein
LLATSTISFGRCIYECFSTSHNNPQNVRFNMTQDRTCLPRNCDSHTIHVSSINW